MADKSGCGEKERPLYLIQIQYLDEKLKRYMLECDELEKQNKVLASQHSTLEQDNNMTECLKRSLAAKEKRVDELNEQLERGQKETEALKLQHIQEIQELQERCDEFKSVMKMQVAKSEELKMELIPQLSDILESLEKQLISQRKEHEAVINSMTMKAGLQRDMMTSWTDDIQKVKNQTIEKNTSEILQEERAKHKKRLEQVQFLMYDSTALQKEIHDLQDRKSDLVMKMDDLKKRLSKSMLENSTSKEEVKQLQKKCHQLWVELKDCNNTHECLRAKEEHFRQALLSASKECSQKTAEVSQLGTEVQRQKSRNKHLEDIMQEAVIILRHILTDTEKASDTQWKMERLLDILESTAPEGPTSAFEDSTVKSRRGQKLQTTNPKPARKVCSQKTSSSVETSTLAPQQTDPEAGSSTSTDC